jgi:hypothetical protein
MDIFLLERYDRHLSQKYMLWIWKIFPSPVCINQRMPIDGAKSIDCIAVHLLHSVEACSPPQKNKFTDSHVKV